MKSFPELQSELGRAWAVNRPGAGVDHVLVVLPSYSVGESLLSHYGMRIPALEHRYLVAYLLLNRIQRCQMVFVSCEPPDDEIVDYYTSLLPSTQRASARSRLRLLTVPDRSPRSVAAKLRERPELLEELRRFIADRPVFIEPWNVTEQEVEIAVRLQAPINGTAPELWPLGYKSAGRRLFAEAGVPMPIGQEDVRTVEDVIIAIAAILAAHPTAAGVVIKHDNSGAGDGNVVIGLRQVAPGQVEADVRERIQALPEWYLRDLGTGGVVEELITGLRFASPSVQADITPAGDVTVLATHEQVLGGETGQAYQGCRFPADPAYARDLVRYGLAIGQQLACRGAMGRFSVDFAAVSDADGQWRLYALEINLRKGGTTHPYAALRNLVPGRYDIDSGQWIAVLDGMPRSYCSTDNIVDATWVGLPPATVIKSIAERGLQFDYRTGTGVVLHMLSCLAIDGRFGMTALGRTPEHAAELYEEAKSAVALGAVQYLSSDAR